MTSRTPEPGQTGHPYGVLSGCPGGQTGQTRTIVRLSGGGTMPLAAVETALNAVLHAAIEHDENTRKVAHPGGVIAEFKMPERLPSKAEINAAYLARDPVAASLRMAVTSLGWMAFVATKSIEAMQDLAERVADQDDKKFGHRLSIIDAAWNGIGDDSGRWWS